MSGADDPADNPAITVKGLAKSYNFGRVKALTDVSLQVNQGDVFALIGPNGAGKTTLMGCMLGLLKPQRGRITIFGHPPDDIRVRSVTGFLPERPTFESWMTAKQFVEFHHMLAKRPAGSMREEVDQVLSDVDLSHVAKREIRKFSRGMLQRLGLAQVLIGRPRLCFLDEPTQGMDPPGMELVRNLLVRLRKDGVTVVLNSHHLEEVERACNRFAFVRKGTIEAEEEVGSSNTRLLIVEWPLDYVPDRSVIAQCAKQIAGELISLDSVSAKILLNNRSASAALIKELVMQEILVEQAYFEKSSLSVLFSTPFDKDMSLKQETGR